jgi:nitrite reductase/ring-hydroxylating ferredoxin subunit
VDDAAGTAPGWGEPCAGGFVANVGGRIVAFHNRCPHTGARLCYRRERVSLDGLHIRCPLHGALFDADGHSVRGPCRAERLKPLNDGGQVTCQDRDNSLNKAG